MSENKKSFILYSDLIHTARKMSKEKIGELFLTILQYVNDENPIPDDLLIEIAFEPIKQQLNRDFKNWEEIKKKRSKAGIASAESRKHQSTNSTHVNTTQQSTASSTVNVNENVTVNVNDTVNDTVNDNERELKLGSSPSENSFYPSFEEVNSYFLKNEGSQKMAEKFFNTHSSTGWIVKGSRIKDFRGMAKNFISSWKENEKPKRITADPGRQGVGLTLC
jgi:Family of unknown function (DUF6291)